MDSVGLEFEFDESGVELELELELEFVVINVVVVVAEFGHERKGSIDILIGDDGVTWVR